MIVTRSRKTYFIKVLIYLQSIVGGQINSFIAYIPMDISMCCHRLLAVLVYVLAVDRNADIQDCQLKIGYQLQMSLYRSKINTVNNIISKLNM